MVIQNALVVRLSREIWNGLAVEVRYSLYANEFAQNGVRYRRQVIGGGLSYTWEE